MTAQIVAVGLIVVLIGPVELLLHLDAQRRARRTGGDTP